MRYHVFGDTGGHAPQLFAALTEIGVDIESGVIPNDVTIIHCGDLIHKGQHSKVILAVVDTLIRNNPGQWIQILGNHEFQHIEGAPYFWKCDCDIEDIGIIEDWYEEGLATPTWVLESAKEIELYVKKLHAPIDLSKGIFFSHAGLTRTWYEKFFEGKSLKQGSESINQLDVWTVNAFGEMMGRAPNYKAGPVWATGSHEVYVSWAFPYSKTPLDMDFVQFHGHTTSFQWPYKKWWARNDLAFRDFREHTKVDVPHRATITALAGGTLIGIDPGFNATADLRVQPYIVLTD